MKNLLGTFILCVFTVTGVHASQGAAPPQSKTRFVTQNSIITDGLPLNYTAVAEETNLPAKHGLPAARYFSFSYLAGKPTQPERPVTFLFNGGPGSASHWLHLGGMGPQRTVIDLGGSAQYQTSENSESLLSASDLVFIDPIGTGFSKVQKPTEITSPPPPQIKAQEFWGVVEDAKSITDFILVWLKQHNRLNSPIYIAGESYGTLRATLIADELEREHNVSVNGLILLSAAQNYRNIRTPDGSVMGYVSYLPTYAATAWFHKKAGRDHPDIETFLAKARDFAVHDYSSALISGNRLSDPERSEVAKDISTYVGLHPTYIYDNNLRVGPLVFLKRLLPIQRKKVSRLDSRYTGALENPKTDNYGLDPYASVIREPFIQAAQTYLNNVLKIPKHKGDYISSARNHPYWRWNWNVWGEGNVPSGARFINVIPNLERTLEANKKLKVMVASGYYDFATPFHSVENAFSELNAGQERVTFHYYKAGHIIYLDDTARQHLSNDIKAFIEHR